MTGGRDLPGGGHPDHAMGGGVTMAHMTGSVLGPAQPPALVRDV